MYGLLHAMQTSPVFVFNLFKTALYEPSRGRMRAPKTTTITNKNNQVNNGITITRKTRKSFPHQEVNHFQPFEG